MADYKTLCETSLFNKLSSLKWEENKNSWFVQNRDREWKNNKITKQFVISIQSSEAKKCFAQITSKIVACDAAKRFIRPTRLDHWKTSHFSTVDVSDASNVQPSWHSRPTSIIRYWKQGSMLKNASSVSSYNSNLRF